MITMIKRIFGIEKREKALEAARSTMMEKGNEIAKHVKEINRLSKACKNSYKLAEAFNVK